MSSGVSEGSVLAPIMFIINIKDIVKGIGNYMSLFAINAKLLKTVNCDWDCTVFQKRFT